MRIGEALAEGRKLMQGLAPSLLPDVDKLIRRHAANAAPAPDEERIYYIGRFGKPPLKVVIKGVPPCLYCGESVPTPSMDGPLVCCWCDTGQNKDGTPWDGKVRRAHHKEMIEKYFAEARARGEKVD